MIYICIPSHNEERTIGVLLWKIRQVLTEFPRDYELLLLDDASDDGTAEVLAPYARILPLTVLRHNGRKGYAASLDELVREAVRRSDYPRRDVVLTVQADFTEEPDDIPALLKRIESGADIVTSRAHIAPEHAPRQLRWMRAVMGRMLRRLDWPENVNDVLSGLRAYRVIGLRKALEERGGERLLDWYDGWAANAALLRTVRPYVRRVDEVATTLRPDRRQRPSRFDVWATARQLLRLAFGRRSSIPVPPRQGGAVLVPAGELSAATREQPSTRAENRRRGSHGRAAATAGTSARASARGATRDGETTASRRRRADGERPERGDREPGARGEDGERGTRGGRRERGNRSGARTGRAQRPDAGSTESAERPERSERRERTRAARARSEGGARRQRAARGEHGDVRPERDDAGGILDDPGAAGGDVASSPRPARAGRRRGRTAAAAAAPLPELDGLPDAVAGEPTSKNVARKPRGATAGERTGAPSDVSPAQRPAEAAAQEPPGEAVQRKRRRRSSRRRGTRSAGGDTASTRSDSPVGQADLFGGEQDSGAPTVGDAHAGAQLAPGSGMPRAATDADTTESGVSPANGDMPPADAAASGAGSSRPRRRSRRGGRGRSRARRGAASGANDAAAEASGEQHFGGADASAEGASAGHSASGGAGENIGAGGVSPAPTHSPLPPPPGPAHTGERSAAPAPPPAPDRMDEHPPAQAPKPAPPSLPDGPSE